MGKFISWLETEKTPDYSFDRWVKSAEDLKGQVDSLVGTAKEKEAELDKDAEKKKKEVEDEDKKDRESDYEFKDDNQKKLWGQLQKIAKERSEKNQGKDSDEGKSSSKGRAGHQAKDRGQS